MPRLSEDQLAERRRGLGASDVSTVAGVNPWGSVYELYLEKIGELDTDAQIDDASRGRMERGHRFEDIALEWDRDANGGEPYRRVNRTVWHPRLPFLFCHPDAIRYPFGKTRRLIEVKTSARRWTEVPRHVEVQAQAQMACTGATSCDVVVLGFDGPPTRFLLLRDEELITALEGVCSAFWDRVERKDPPPMDGSAGASRWLDKTRWRDEPERRASDEESELIARYLKAKSVITEQSAEVDRIGNIIKFGAEGNRIYAPGVGRVTWVAPGETRATSWKSVVDAVRPLVTDESSLDEMIEHHTTVKERGGYLKVTPDERTA